MAYASSTIKSTQYGEETILIPHSSETQELIEKKVKNLLYGLEQVNALHVQELQLLGSSCLANWFSCQLH